MTDGVLLGAIVLTLGMAIGAYAARYHYLQVIYGQRDAIEALEDYIDSHSERDDAEASAEELGYD